MGGEGDPAAPGSQLGGADTVGTFLGAEGGTAPEAAGEGETDDLGNEAFDYEIIDEQGEDEQESDGDVRVDDGATVVVSGAVGQDQSETSALEEAEQNDRDQWEAMVVVGEAGEDAASEETSQDDGAGDESTGQNGDERSKYSLLTKGRIFLCCSGIFSEGAHRKFWCTVH